MAGRAASTWTVTTDGHIAPQPASSALLIIDTQTDFVDGGASAVAGTTGVLPTLGALHTAFRAAALPIVHVVRLYRGDDVDRVRRTTITSGTPIVVPDSEGAQVVPELRQHWTAVPAARRLLAGELVEVAGGEVVMWKPRWSAFHRTRLHQYLTDLGINTVVVAGCNFPNCPRATIYDSSSHDYRVLVPSDAVSGITNSHLDELGKIGALHADTATITATLNQAEATR